MVRKKSPPCPKCSYPVQTRLYRKLTKFSEGSGRRYETFEGIAWLCRWCGNVEVDEKFKPALELVEGA